MSLKCHKIYLNRGGSYVDSPDWITKKKKTITNSINKKDNKCFQYTVTVALNHGEIGKHAEKISKIKRFINKYKWEGINFPSEKADWKKIAENNVKVAHNIFFAKKEKIYPAYVSKNNSNREKQVVLIMILNEEKREWSEALATWSASEEQQWHYLALKKLSALLRGITSWWFSLSESTSFFRNRKKNLNCINNYVTIKNFVML